MWIYEKKLIYPVKNLRPNARMAKLIAMLLGRAEWRDDRQRHIFEPAVLHAGGMCAGDIDGHRNRGTEPCGNAECNARKCSLNGCSKDELRAAGMDGWAAEFGDCPFPVNWNRESWTAAYVGTTGDPIANIANDMAAEEKARAGYEGVIRMCDDPDTIGALQFLREREVAHYQRFGEALQILYNYYDSKKCF